MSAVDLAILLALGALIVGAIWLNLRPGGRG